MYKRHANKGLASAAAKKAAAAVTDEKTFVIGTDVHEVAKEDGAPGSDFLAVVVVEQYADTISETDMATLREHGVYVQEQPRPEDIKERKRMEEQAKEQASQQPTRTEMEGFDGRKVTAEIPIAAGRKGLSVRNGATQPAVGTMARMVWDTADRMSAENKRPVLGEELRAELLPKGFAGSSISANYKAWRQFWDVSDEAIKEIEASLTGPQREALNAQKEEEKRIKAEIKAKEKEAKAIEIAARKEAKRIEKEELKAAKRRSKDEARALKEAQKGEEAKKRLEERLAKNAAIAEERMREAERKAEERRKQAEDRRRLRLEEFARRQAEAQAKLDALRNGTGGGATASTDGGESPSGEGSAPDQSESASDVGAS